MIFSLDSAHLISAYIPLGGAAAGVAGTAGVAKDAKAAGTAGVAKDAKAGVANAVGVAGVAGSLFPNMSFSIFRDVDGREYRGPSVNTSVL